MSAQRSITRALLKLPDALLVTMAGGSPVVLDGRKLDARFQFIGHAAAKRPVPDPMTAQIARLGTDQLTFLFGGPSEPGVKTASVAIPTDGRTIAARAYRPDGQRPEAPLLVFAHFGGGVVGNLETCEAFCSILARVIGCPVLSIDYRLAPEHPWPQGLDDVLIGFEWARDHADQFGAPKGVAALGGDSMGGNFTAVITQDLKAAGKPQPFFQLLIYPATDITAQSGSMETFGQSFPLTADTMTFFMANYLPAGTDPTHLRISPALNPDLSGLAPALVVMAGHDPLYDQGHAYADRLEAAGVSTRAMSFDSLAHGFTAFSGAIPAADRACREIAGAVLKAYRALGG